jgi:hydrogenase maturation protease
MADINPLLKTIIIGYGNPGRQDDGLGPAFIESFQRNSKPIVELQSNYQLTVEDALEIASYQQVIFVDASIDCQAPFFLEEISETKGTGFGSHSLSPQAVVQLSNSLYQHFPKAHILAIRGYEFDQFEEKLSETASENLQQASAYLASQLNA